MITGTGNRPDKAGSRFKIIGTRGILLATTALALSFNLSPVVAQSLSSAESPAAPQVSGALRSFDIPAQPLTSALAVYSRQSGLQVSLASSTSRGLTSNPVKGIFTPDQALARLLQGTGIDFHISADRAAVIGRQIQVDDSVAADGSTVLDTITVLGKTNRNAASGSGYLGTPDWVYETPASVSVVSREQIQNSPARNARDLLDTVAGVYANRSELQNPGISVNVRGLQDQNRVVTMIDGARQNFQRSGHGSSQRTYVDTAFIREIDIEKSGTSGVGGAGSLGGSVNFRTIEADDLIAPGRDWGAELNLTTGTNEFFFDGSWSTAVRLSDSFAVLGGISRKRIGAYEIGKNGDIRVLDSAYKDGALVFTGQEVTSTLLKAEGDLTDDVKFSLGWLRYDTDFSQGSYNLSGIKDEDTETVVNNTITASLDWDPESELINLKTRLWYNHTKNHEKRGNADNDLTLPLDYKLGTFGGSIENTSYFMTSLGELSLNYGAEAFHDDGRTVTLFDTINDDGLDMGYSYRGMNPSGKRDVASAFINATLEHEDWLTVSGGFRYDYYRLKGSTRIYGLNYREIIGYDVTPGVCLPPPLNICTPDTSTPIYGPWMQRSAGIDIDKSGDAILPTAMVAVKPYDWLQPFVKYSQSYRPPTITETFFSGGHPGVNVTQNAPNPWLEAERAETFEIGANISHDGVLSADDEFRLKVVGFYREVENYISLGEIWRSETGRRHTSFVNLDGTTYMKGVEIEGNYDAGQFYLGGSFTWIDTNFADSYIYRGVSEGSYVDGSPSAAAPSVIFVPPKLKVAFDAGVRLFEEKLTLGGRVTHVGAATPSIGILHSNYVTGDYTLYDLYGSYAFNENVKLRVAINNLTDVAYVPALGETGLPAPGRTATASLNFKF